jgi:hypothetical protein
MNVLISADTPFASMLPALNVIAAARCGQSFDRYEFEDTVLRGGGFAWDIGGAAAQISAQIDDILADKAISDAAELAELTANPPVPAMIMPAQMRIVLALHGVSAASVEAVIGTLSDPTKTIASIRWEYATTFSRHDPVLKQLGAALGFSPDQIDDLFREAVTY